MKSITLKMAGSGGPSSYISPNSTQLYLHHNFGLGRTILNFISDGTRWAVSMSNRYIHGILISIGTIYESKGKREPDYAFLKDRAGIGTATELKSALLDTLAKTNMTMKKRDFEHLLFSERNSEKILRFAEYIEQRIS